MPNAPIHSLSALSNRLLIFLFLEIEVAARNVYSEKSIVRYVHVLVPCTIQLSIGAKKTIDSPVCKKETQNNYAYHCISEHKKKNSARVHLFDDAICINMEYLFIRVCRLLQQFSMPFC